MIKPKIIIGTPINEDKLYCWDEYLKSIKAIQGVDEIILCDTSKDGCMQERIVNAGFTYIHWYADKAMNRVVAARNMIRAYALNSEINYLLFIDADIIAPKNIAKKLSKSEKDIITGLGIILQGIVPIPAAKILKGDTYYAFPKEKINGEVHEVDLTGLGCCLISKRILNKIRFRCERDNEGKLIKSEDHCFSLDCKDAAKRIFFDTSVVTHHRVSGKGHWDFDTA